MFDYESIAETADGLIAEFGRPAELRRVSGNRPCLVVDVGNAQSMAAMEADGQLVRSTDLMLLVSAVGLDPPPSSEEDKLWMDERDHRIVVVRPLQPAETVVMYEVLARR